MIYSDEDILRAIQDAYLRGGADAVDRVEAKLFKRPMPPVRAMLDKYLDEVKQRIAGGNNATSARVS